MFKKYIKFIFFFLLTLLVINGFFDSHYCLASQDDIYKQMNSAGGTAWGDVIVDGSGLGLTIQTIISVFLGLLGIIFLVLIIYAGFNWMTAQGDEEKVTKAKDTLQRAVIGLIIITAAYSITFFVFTYLPGKS